MDSIQPMRRSPQQERGQRRVTLILDAAAQVFIETGYEAATTNAIAIRANTSIGSVYQFFPNKRSILDALATRYQTQLKAIIDVTVEAQNGSFQAALDTLIDRVANFYAMNPAFRPMFFATQSSKTLTQVADEMCEDLVNHVTQMCSDAVSNIDPNESKFYSTIVVFMLRALIPLSQMDSALQPDEIVPQLKRMVFAYLSTVEPFRDQLFIL